MSLFSQLVLRDSIEIRTTPEEIWEFFIHLEENYKIWHPEDHILFKWTKGSPMESGSSCYGEEILGGELKRLKATIGEVVPNRKIVFRYTFPLSLVSPGFEWLIEPKGSHSIFTALGYVRCMRFYRFIARKHVDTSMKVGKKHIREEGENLRRILESKKS